MENNQNSPIYTVNKIGGKNMTTLSDVGTLVRVLKDRNESPTLVVSAFTKVTNALIKVMDDLNETDYKEEDIDQAFQTVDALHEEIFDTFLQGESADRARVVYQQEYEQLRSRLMAHKQTSNVLMPVAGSFSIRDQVIGFGENAAKKILGIYLEQEGHEAEVIDGVQTVGEITNGSEIISMNKLHQAMRNGIKESVLEAQTNVSETRGNVVQILGGHIAGTPRGIAIDVGRSYTDTTALHAAYALRDAGIPVEAVRYWKDVKGVLTANPQDLIAGKHEARVINQVSFTEGLEMASAGSQLVQIDALALARREERKPDGHKGLKIELSDIRDPEKPAGTFFSGKEIRTDQAFKSIASKQHTDTITISVPEMVNRAGFCSAIHQVFTKHGLSIDATPTEGTSAMFSIDLPQDASDMAEKRKAIQAACGELKALTVNGERFDIAEGDIEWRQDLACVSLVGNELIDTTGALSWVTSVLAANDINIEAISHTTKQKRVSVFVSKNDRQKAVQLLHSIMVDGNEDDIEALVNTRIAELRQMSESFNGCPSVRPKVPLA
ncbi:aspartate kinase [Candidatus Peregrinibacteria bacterium]|nr:aspartate kinase [Candidatus Peregrinibacteria bacterium]